MIIEIKDKDKTFLYKEYDIDINVSNLYGYDAFTNDWLPVGMYTVQNALQFFGGSVSNGFWIKRTPIIFESKELYLNNIYLDKNGIKVPDDYFKYKYKFFVYPIISAFNMYSCINDGTLLTRYITKKKYQQYFGNSNLLLDTQGKLASLGNADLLLLSDITTVASQNPFYLCDFWYFILNTNIGTKNQTLGKGLLIGEKLYDLASTFSSLRTLAKSASSIAGQITSGAIKNIKDLAIEYGLQKEHPNFINLSVISYADGITKYFTPADLDNPIIYCYDLDGNYAYECTINNIPLSTPTLEDLGYNSEIAQLVIDAYKELNINYNATYDLRPMAYFQTSQHQGKLTLNVSLNNLLTGGLENDNYLIKPFRSYFIGGNHVAYYVEVGINE